MDGWFKPGLKQIPENHKYQKNLVQIICIKVLFDQFNYIQHTVLWMIITIGQRAYAVGR